MKAALSLLATASVLAGCMQIHPPGPGAPEDIVAIKARLDHRFTIRPDSPFIDWDGEQPVAGDCDTYAHAARLLLIRAGYAAKTYYANDETCYARGTSVIHAITCTDDWCVDMYGDKPVARRSVPYELH